MRAVSSQRVAVASDIHEKRLAMGGTENEAPSSSLENAVESGSAENQTNNTEVESWASIVERMERVADSLYRKVDERLASHLSVSRIVGVARELRELVKVISIYA